GYPRELSLPVPLILQPQSRGAHWLLFRLKSDDDIPLDIVNRPPGNHLPARGAAQIGPPALLVPRFPEARFDVTLFGRERGNAAFAEVALVDEIGVVS